MSFNGNGDGFSSDSKVQRVSATLKSTNTICSRLLFLLLPSLALTFCHAQEGGVQDRPLSRATTPHQVYTEKITRTYSLPFGKANIALPGNASVEAGGLLDPTSFPNARYCGHCHQQAYHEWRQSLHANSFRAPFYSTSDDLLVHSKGIAASKYCNRCHNPIAVLSGALDTKTTDDRSFDSDGITCTVCHSIQGVEPKLGNGRYVMGIPAAIVDEKGNRVPGIVPDAEILAHLDRHAKAEMQDFYRQPEFCSACHKASLPTELNNYKWLRSFTPYDEWQDSMFSHQNPLTFYSANYVRCQDCHMRREPIHPQYAGANEETFPSHRWIAGNTAVPFYYGYSDQLEKTTVFLRSGRYIDIDLFALKPADGSQMPEPIGSQPVSIKPGGLVQAYIVIENKGIGHSLIPELRDLFEAWVHFSVKNASGETIYESGFLQPDGSLDPYAHSFVNLPMDAKGDFIDKHMVWNEHAEGYDNTIQSGHSQLVRYQFHIPRKLVGSITITAAVEYRHFRQNYLDFVLGKDHPAYPVVELATRSQTFHLGMNVPPKPMSTDNPEWKRWNNFGIALLDEEQFDEAAQAFERVNRLRPEYKNGYINLALAYIQSGKFVEARTQLKNALALKQDDARALYYMALVERQSGQLTDAIGNLERVVAQYPLCRAARRDLGIAYEEQHRTKDALEQFKALQDIDPDDLEAHQHLASIYRRAGMLKEAMAEEGQYEKEAPDPAAPTYSQDFLRKFPAILKEDVPSDLHTDTPAGAGRSLIPRHRSDRIGEH
jgi:tetratricopeptide (TPR) repeat protein